MKLFRHFILQRIDYARKMGSPGTWASNDFLEVPGGGDTVNKGSYVIK